MSESVSAPSAPTNTASSTEGTALDTPLVSTPLKTSKPYDDDMLEAYAEEAQSDNESTSNTLESQEKESDSSTEIQIDQETKEESDPAQSRKGDTEYDGTDEIQLKGILNGKNVEFTVKDAKQAYLKQEEFNRNMDRRISHVAAREQKLKAEYDGVKSQIAKVIDVAQKGDFVTSIRALAKLAAGQSGMDVIKFEKEYFAQLDKIREVMTQLTPEQQEAFWAKREAAEARAEANRIKNEQVSQAQKSELEQKVATLQQEHSVPQEEFWGNYKYIVDNMVGEGKVYQTPNHVTPEDVIKYSLAVKHETKVLEAAQSLGIESEEILDEVSRITRGYPDLSVQDIVKVINDSGVAKFASRSSVENLNRKAVKSNSQFKKASSTKNEKTNGLDKEDLEFLYRNQPKAYRRLGR